MVKLWLGHITLVMEIWLLSLKGTFWEEIWDFFGFFEEKGGGGRPICQKMNTQALKMKRRRGQ